MRFASRQLKRHGKAIIASLLACLVLLLDGLAVSPHAHQYLHHDAGSSQHHCAVTVFAHGQMDSASVEILPVVSLYGVESSFSAVVSVCVPKIENLPAGRAPPVVSVNS